MFNIVLDIPDANLISNFITIFSKTRDLLSSLSNSTVSDRTVFNKLIEVNSFKVDFVNFQITLVVEENTNQFIDNLSVNLLSLLDSEFISNYSYSIGNF